VFVDGCGGADEDEDDGGEQAGLDEAAAPRAAPRPQPPQGGAQRRQQPEQRDRQARRGWRVVQQAGVFAGGDGAGREQGDGQAQQAAAERLGAGPDRRGRRGGEGGCLGLASSARGRLLTKSSRRSSASEPEA
jgi:hypothetical protein